MSPLRVACMNPHRVARINPYRVACISPLRVARMNPYRVARISPLRAMSLHQAYEWTFTLLTATFMMCSGRFKKCVCVCSDVEGAPNRV